MLQEMLTISLFLISGRTLTFRIQKILVFSKIIFLNLLDPNQTIFLTAAILKRLD